MEVILSDKIFEFLDRKGYEYYLKGIKLSTKYKVASVFSIISNGFYYLVTENYLDKIHNSLVIINEGTSNLDCNNSFIVLNKELDVQLVYYELLNYIFKNEHIESIDQTAIIDLKVEFGENITIGRYSIIEPCHIGNNVFIGDYVKIHKNSVIGNNVRIDDGSIIGAPGVAWVWNMEETNRIIQPQLGGVKIDDECVLGANTIVVRGSLSENTIIGKGSILAPACRLGHGTKLGKLVHFANNVITGGNTIIGDRTFVGSGVIFRPKVKVHSRTIVGAGSVVVKDTSREHVTLMGVPAKEYDTKSESQGLPKFRVLTK